MAKYINPPGESKVAWLKREAEEMLLEPPASVEDGAGFTLVCLVSNESFVAARILETDYDLQQTLNPSDKRPKVWYWVDPEKLPAVSA